MISSPYVQLAALALVIAVAFIGAVVIGPGLLGPSENDDDESAPLDRLRERLKRGARKRP